MNQRAVAVLAVAVLVVVVVSGCSRDLFIQDPPGPGSVSGRVVLAEPGSTEKRPLGGAEVRVLGSGFAATTTPAGTFTIEGLELPSGTVLVRAEVGGSLKQRALQLAEFGTGPTRHVDLGDIVLGENARLRGKALRGDLTGPTGHGGSSIFVPGGPFAAITADDGSFFFDQLPEGPLELYVFRTGFVPISLGGIRLRSGETVELREVSLTVDPNPQPGTVRGSVSFIPEASGLGDTKVELVAPTMTVPLTVAADFTFSGANVPVGLYRLSASRSGYTQIDVFNVLIVSGREANFGQLTLTTAPPFDPGPGPMTPDSGFDAGLPDAGTDAGLPDAGLDAGAGPFCAVQADCSAGYWCDRSRCVPLCQTNPECGFGRVCDPVTRTCVTSCTGTCAAGEICNGANVCQAVCDLTFPCPSGQRCTAGMCGPECVLSSDCGDPFLVCDLGICKRSGLCSTDVDCLREEVCTSGQCGARPTDAGVRPDGGTWTDGGLVFSCSAACDCRSGEICADGFCAPDLIPTRFVRFGADGGGASANDPSGSITPMPDGGVVALIASDTWDLGSGTLSLLPNTRLAGGFTACSATRWSRSQSARTTIASTGTGATPGPIFLNGNAMNPVSNAALSNLVLRVTGTARCSNVFNHIRFAPNLTLTDVDGDMQLGACGLSTRTDFMRIEDSNNLTLRRVRLVNNSGGSGNGTGFLQVVRSNGLIEDLSSAPVSINSDQHTLRFESPTGTSTLRRINLARWVGQSGLTDQQILVQGCGDSAILIEDVYAQFQGMQTGTTGVSTVLTIDDCNAITMRRVVLDGAGHSGILHTNDVYGLELVNSGGTIDDVTVALPSPTVNVARTAGVRITGPRATWQLSRVNVTANGGSGTDSTGGPTIGMGVQGIRINAVNQGPLVIRNASVAIKNNIAPHGIYVHSTNVPSSLISILDSSIDVEGNNSCGYDAVGVHARAPLRIERNQISAGNAAYAAGLFLAASTEVYGNVIRLGPSAGTSTCLSRMAGSGTWGNWGVHLFQAQNFTTRLIGNTIDPAGMFANAMTVGVGCFGAASLTMQSNIVMAGRGNESRLLGPEQSIASATTCWNGSTTVTNNYFASVTGNTSANERLLDGGVVLNGGMGSGNTFGGTTSCFAPGTLSDGGAFGYFLAPGSGCADKGVIGVRNDMTPVLLDFFGRPRDAGTGPDIGAVEGP